MEPNDYSDILSNMNSNITHNVDAGLNGTYNSTSWVDTSNQVQYNPTKSVVHNTLSSVDTDGKIQMRCNNIHIQPVSNGFIVIKHEDDGIRTYSFNDFIDVLEFLKDNPIMDLDSDRVASNV